jgi:hypothetical protein
MEGYSALGKAMGVKELMPPPKERIPLEEMKKLV